MKEHIPPATFWQSGQTFLIFAREQYWQQVIDSCNQVFVVSKFDSDEIGQDLTVSIEDARALEKIARQLPTQGDIRLCVIRNADKCSDAAANALLKILEDVPLRTRFLLLAQTRHILPTIRSRCSEWSYNYSSLSVAPLLPLDKTQDFATVSLKISKIIEDGQAIALLDQWTEALVKDNNHQPLHWLIEARNLLDGTAINANALLEVTYIHITKGIALPKSALITGRTHGHI